MQHNTREEMSMANTSQTSISSNPPQFDKIKQSIHEKPLPDVRFKKNHRSTLIKQQRRHNFAENVEKFRLIQAPQKPWINEPIDVYIPRSHA